MIRLGALRHPQIRLFMSILIGSIPRWFEIHDFEPRKMLSDDTRRQAARYLVDLPRSCTHDPTLSQHRSTPKEA